MNQQLSQPGDDLHRIVAEVFKIEMADVRDEMGSQDIEAWDSLGQLKLIAALEKHYGMRFEISEVFEIFCIADIRRIIQQKGLI